MANKKKDEIQFFGDMDKRPDGKTRSYTPIWATKLPEQLEEEIAVEKERLKMSKQFPEHTPAIEERLNMLLDKQKEIKDSTVTLTGEQEDRVSRARKTIAEKISERLFTASEMDGMKDIRPEVEADMMTKHDIKLAAHEVEICKAASVPIVGGKVSRKGLEKAYRLGSLMLGEDASIENLRRRDYHHGQQHIIRDKDTAADRMINAPAREQGAKREEPEKKETEIKAPGEKKYKTSF
jgi:hypothetical protein